MDSLLRKEILDRVQANPLIAGAAIVGSGAKGTHEDAFSDLDLLIITHEVQALLASRNWLPRSTNILLFEVHLEKVVSVLWNNMQKLDATIYDENEAAANLIVLEYSIIKGGESFSNKLQLYVQETRRRAPHLGPDVGLGNILLLLVTAHQKLQRQENLSAHQFLAAACDMTVSYDRRKGGLKEGIDDLLDPLRRLEKSRGTIAAVIESSLFQTPKEGIRAVAEYIRIAFADELLQEHLSILQNLTSKT